MESVNLHVMAIKVLNVCVSVERLEGSVSDVNQALQQMRVMAVNKDSTQSECDTATPLGKMWNIISSKI